MSFLAFSQTPILTMISDGDCSGGTPKVVEIYAQGTVDFSLYSLEIQTNSNTTWGSTENLGALGMVTDAFVYVYGSAAAAIFATEYPSAVNTYGAGGSVNFNGDDRIRIIEDASGSVIDQYGEEGIDGTDTFWEYKDGFGKRINSTGPDGAFVQANWEYNNGVLNNQGSCQGGDIFESISITGSFVSPGGGTEPGISASPIELTNFVQFVGTPSDEQTTEVSGSNLSSDITAAVSGDYEISLTTSTGFGSSLVLAQTAGEVSATMIYVRLNGSVASSAANGLIILSSDGSDNDTITLSGEILNSDPVLFSSEDTLIGFSHFVGVPSQEQTFELSGNYLTNDITVDVSGDYEISLSSAGTFSNSLLVPNIAGQVESTSVFVRLNGVVQNYNQEGILTISSQSQAVSHTVNSGNYYYQPQLLTINVGDTVYWINDGGFHNVNFITNTVTGENYNNPESFASTPTSDSEMYFHVFTAAGTYEYDCSVGSHAANGMIGTITVIGSAAPDSKTVALFGESLDYSPYTIGEVTTNTANGVADSLDVLVSLVGVVHCIDFDGNEGISFTIIDNNNDGINVFNFDDVSDYVVNEGDKITVLGKIGQFNGLTQVFADSILVLESGLETVTPTIVTALDESTEAQWITIENVNFVDPIATFPSGSNNIDVTDGTNIFTLRIDSDTDIPEGAAPQVDFSVTGVGGQYDNSDPYDSGYQLFPCGLGSFTPNDVSDLSGVELLAVSVIPNPFNDFIEIKSNGLSNVQVEIHDAQGRLVQSSIVDNGMLINTSNWMKGIYMITLTDGNQNIRTERMIK